ncbi:MAG: efflux RND transporter permease subunit [Dehalococcoidia bacterium]|nr:efflux RND transporter permease subunit [Dehalococcoidia bacterium]
MRSLTNIAGRVLSWLNPSNLTRLSLINRWVTFALATALVGVSVWSVLRMEQEMIPNIQTGMTTVVTQYPFHSSEDVMTSVTEPIEDVIMGIEGCRRVSSSSVEGMSVILAEFDYGSDMDQINRTLEDRLSRAALPSDMQRTLVDPTTGEEWDNPYVFPLDISEMPVVAYSLGADLDPNALYSIVANQVVAGLQGIKGVLEDRGIRIEGYREDVIVRPIAANMNANGVSMSQLVGVLWRSGGYGSLDELRNAPVSASATVGQVAEVGFGPAPNSAITRTNGKTSVILYVTKSSDGNTVEVADEVESRVEELKRQLPDVEFIKIFDQSDYIKESIGELTWDALIGGILAVIVIFVFLLTVRGSLVIALSIPFSILVGFLVMSWVGVTINILTLGAMTIAVGRIVDDSIVMLEVIYRRLRQGQPFRQAALEGSKEVAMPIASATLATVAIFIPLAFVGGMVGEMFIPFAETITFALLGSLLVSVTIVPALSSVLVPKQIRPEAENAWYHRLYVPALKWALSHRALTVITALVLFAGSLGLLPVVGTSFMPSMGEKEVMIEVEMDVGTDLATTDSKAVEVEQVIDSFMSAGNSGIELYYTMVGSSSSFGGAFSALTGAGGGSNSARIEIVLTNDANMKEVAADLEHRIALAGLQSAGCRITVTPLAAGLGEEMDPGKFKVFLVSDNYTRVDEAARELTTALEEMDGLKDVENDASKTVARPYFETNDLKIAQFYASQGLNPLDYVDDLMMESALLLQGTELRDSAGGGQTISIGDRIVFVDTVMNTADESSLPGILVNGGTTASATLADWTDYVGFRPSQLNIHRLDGYRSATVSAVVTKKDVGAVNARANGKADAIADEHDVDTRIGGVAEYMNETFRQLGIAMIVAIVISIAIVVASFRSLLSALLIIVSLPLASIGALLGLLVTGHTLGASGMMGMLMLVGIVLTNAIVLLALVDQLRKQGLSTHDALIQGGRTRIRPILMTAITTMIALLPLALGYGQGILLASELAIVVLGGLFSSTILTLLVIPVLYSLTDPIRRKAKVVVPVSEADKREPPAA